MTSAENDPEKENALLCVNPVEKVGDQNTKRKKNEKKNKKEQKQTKIKNKINKKKVNVHHFDI